MNRVLTIASREFSVRVRAKSTIITVLIMMIVLLGAGVGWRIFSPMIHDEETIGVTGQTNYYAALFNSAQAAPESEELTRGLSFLGPTKYGIEVFPDDNKLEQAVQDGSILLGIAGSADKPLIVSKGAPPTSLQLLLQQGYASMKANQYLMKLGGNVKDFQASVGDINIPVKDVLLDGANATVDGFDFGGYITGLILAMILFIFIMSSGQLVATGVVEEKTSRVVEVLISTVSVGQLLMGKILGIAAIGILQALLVVGSAVAAIKISGFSDLMGLNLGALSGWLIIWFLLGIATYMVLYAGTGALVTRQEDIGQALFPLLMLQMVGFYGAVFEALNHGTFVVKILSYLPFLSCYVMPIRQVVPTNVNWWEPIVALAINLAVLPALIWLGARLYRRGVLSTAGKIRLRDALKASDLTSKN